MSTGTSFCVTFPVTTGTAPPSPPRPRPRPPPPPPPLVAAELLQAEATASAAQARTAAEQRIGFSTKTLPARGVTRLYQQIRTRLAPHLRTYRLQIVCLLRFNKQSSGRPMVVKKA